MDHVRELVAGMTMDGYVTAPILTDRDTGLIIDGHHRYAALCEMGFTRIPVYLLPYQDPELRVKLWRPEEGDAPTKAEIIARARAGEVFPPKTTRHVLPITLPRHPVPLDDLRNG